MGFYHAQNVNGGKEQPYAGHHLVQRRLQTHHATLILNDMHTIELMLATEISD